MAELKIYGASDDLLEVDGDFRDEFNCNPDEPKFLAVSDGSAFRVLYDADGIWRLTRLVSGRAEMSKVEGDVEKDTNDIVTLTSDVPFTFVILGDSMMRKDFNSQTQ